MFDDKDQNFDFSTVNTSPPSPRINLQVPGHEENLFRLREILDMVTDNNSRDIIDDRPHDSPTLNSNTLSLEKSEFRDTQDKIQHPNHQGNNMHPTTEGNSQSNTRTISDLAFTVAQTAPTDSGHMDSNPVDVTFDQIINISKNSKYLSPSTLSRIFKPIVIPAQNFAMDPPFEFHPHPPIPPSGVDLHHPITGQSLVPTAMSITSNSAVIAEIRQDQNIADEFFVDCVLPEATLTMFRNGSFQNVQGRASCCFHFDSEDPRMFHAAALSMPGAVVRLPAQPPIDSHGRYQPTGLLFALPIRV